MLKLKLFKLTITQEKCFFYQYKINRLKSIATKFTEVMLLYCANW